MTGSVHADTARSKEGDENAYFVANTLYEGRYYAAAGATEEQARGRLSNHLFDLFGERTAPILDEDNSRILNATLAACFYVERCYNGEKLTEDNLAMDDEFADDLWPEEWRSDIRDCFE